MLGLNTNRNRYLAMLAIGLLLLPVFWASSHFHRGSAHRASCAVCLLATLSLSVLTTGLLAVTLALSRREMIEDPALIRVSAGPRYNGRAPPSIAAL
jgi:hypothetical protein